MVHRYLRLLPLLLSVLSLLVFGSFVPQANAAELAPAPAGAAETHEALSLKAEPLFTLGYPDLLCILYQEWSKPVLRYSSSLWFPI